MFTPLRTARLVIRGFESGDVDPMVARRNDPEAARYQSWTLPFPRARIELLVEDAARLDGPTDGEWWTGTVALATGGEVVGDVVVNLTNGARTAEIGYTFSPAHWSRGYAVEAVEALVGHLWDAYPVSRVAGTLHPDNVASAQVLERTGFVHEGRTRLSYWIDGDNSNDDIYGMTRADRDRWRDRPRQPPTRVELEPVTAANASAVRALRTHHSQTRFVAPVTDSLADALLPPPVAGSVAGGVAGRDGGPDRPAVEPWIRAVTADGELAGFVMVAVDPTGRANPVLWRLLVDRLHQRRGVGHRALELVAAACRARGATALDATWLPGRGSPEPFFLARGFTPIGAPGPTPTVGPISAAGPGAADHLVLARRPLA